VLKILNQTFSGVKGTIFLIVLSFLDSAWIAYSVRDIILTQLVGSELDTLVAFIFFVPLTLLLTISVYRARDQIKLWEILVFQILLVILWYVSGAVYWYNEYRENIL